MISPFSISIVTIGFDIMFLFLSDNSFSGRKNLIENILFIVPKKCDFVKINQELYCFACKIFLAVSVPGILETGSDFSGDRSIYKTLLRHIVQNITSFFMGKTLFIRAVFRERLININACHDALRLI